MKICMVSSTRAPVPPLHGGGVESQVYGLSIALAKYCEEVHVLTISGGSENDPSETNLYFHKVDLPMNQTGSSNIIHLANCELLYALKANLIVKELNIDLIHYHTNHPCFLGINMFRGTPKIFHTHGWLPTANFVVSQREIVRKATRKFETYIDKYNVKYADKVIAVSDFLKKGIISAAHIPQKKVTVVHNAVNSNLFYNDDKGKGRDNSLLFVARMVPEKGLEYLIKAMPLVLHEVPDARLIIVGPQLEIERKSFIYFIKNLISSLDLYECIEFKSRVSVGELRRLYSKAGVFVLPAIWNEPFGVVFLEAMACETPIIGTSVGGIPEIIDGKDIGLLVKPRDHGDLAKAIIAILSNKNLARQMGLAGRKLIEHRYTFDMNAKKMYKVYEDVIERGQTS